MTTLDDLRDDGMQSVSVPERYRLKASFVPKGRYLDRDFLGRLGEFACPFHGWRWHLDGRLKFMLNPEEFEPRPESDLDLVSVSVDTWGGWVFINIDGKAAPLLEYLSPLPERFASYNLKQMRLTWSKTTIMPANWKTVLDAFKEAYHAHSPSFEGHHLNRAQETSVFHHHLAADAYLWDVSQFGAESSHR